MVQSNDLKSIWLELAGEQNVGHGFFRRKLHSDSTDIYLASNSSNGLPAVILEVDWINVPHDAEYPESKKFEVVRIPDQKEKKVEICLKLTDREYNDIFLILAEDLVRRVAGAPNEKKAVGIFINEIRRWQEFLKQYSSSGLSDSAQQGLYGELWCIKNLLSGKFVTAKSVSFWRGPDKAIHDFQIGAYSVETKTYAGSTHPKITISNMRQLDIEGSEHLYLAVLVLDSRMSGTGTLPEMVQSIQNDLSDSAGALAEFEAKLAKYGYYEKHAEQYSQRGYTVLQILLYEVGDRFPRIIPSSLADGIGDVSYSVALSACKESLIGQEQMISMLKESM
jgi:hypothetical protein